MGRHALPVLCACLQDLVAPIARWSAHVDDAVKAPGADEGIVKRIGSVGGSQDDDLQPGEPTLPRRTSLISLTSMISLDT